MNRTLHAVAIAIAAAIAAAAPARADPVADFYRNKTITFVVSSNPGGGYDLLARFVARWLGRFIPGEPALVVENQPGAGGILMSNRISNSAPRDGSVIGLVQRGVLMAQATKQPGVHFDVARFNWIGNVSAEQSLVVAWADAPVKSFEDVRTKGMIVGGTGATSDTEASARLLNAVAGAKIKIVAGYPGTSDVMLAMEKGELDGIADLSWSEMKVKNADLLARHKLIVLAQSALAKSPDFPDAPLALDFVQDETDRQVATLFYAMKAVARPILAAPGVPPERVAALRAGFDAMVRDRGFLAEAKAQKLDLAPTGHAAIEGFIAALEAAPPAVAARLAAILNPPP